MTWASMMGTVVGLVLAASSPLAAQHHGMLARYGTSGALAGTFETPGPASVDYTSVLTQGNGNITTGGQLADTYAIRQLISRFNAQGQYDTSFGWLGVTTADIPNITNETVVNIAFAKGLKILALVQADGTLTRGWMLERFTTAGQLDGTFGYGGFAAATFSSYADAAYPKAIAVYTQPSPPPLDAEKYAVAGSVSLFGGSDLGVSLHQDNGALIGGWGDGGMKRIDLSSQDVVAGVAFDGSGNVLVGGSTFHNNQYKMLVVKLDKQTGALVTSFGNSNPKDGITRISFPGYTGGAYAYGMTRDAWNRVILSGYAQDSAGTVVMALARVNADGTLDTSFSGDGVATTGFDGASLALGFSVSLHLDNNAYSDILVSGFGQFGSLAEVALARFTHQGVLDTGDTPFGTGGRVRTGFAPKHGFGVAVGMTNSSTPVVAGATFE
jgi:uncharacterized delta-60 repeat protein